MASAKTLYPDMDKEPFYGPSNYQPIIESFGEVVMQVDDDGYQGDSRVVLTKDGKYGLLIFGWGSCSGCDSLQACDTYAEIDSLIGGLRDDVKWYDSLEELQKYVAEKDWEIEFCYGDETKRFIEGVAALATKGGSNG